MCVKLFCACMVCEPATALEDLQRRATERALNAPDLEDQLHRLSALLLAEPELHGSLTPSYCSTLPRWKRLGFQDEDPRKDLRTGRLALESLVYLVERYPMGASQMAMEAQESFLDYPFAVASINVTQRLARHLGLVRDAHHRCNMEHRAPKQVLDRFSVLLSRPSAGIDVFGELHAATMARLHICWRSMKRNDPWITIFDFPRALASTMHAVRCFMLKAPLESALEFRGLVQAEPLRQETNPEPSAKFFWNLIPTLMGFGAHPPTVGETVEGTVPETIYF